MTEEQVKPAEIKELKIQVLIIECVVAVLLLILFGFVVYLYFQVQKLNKLVKVLDPMGKYKKVGPSLYVKNPQREIPSISSSFKHFDGRRSDYFKSDDEMADVNERTLRKNEIGTLDRNFFTKSDFDFENISTGSKGSSKKTDKQFKKGQRKKLETEEMDAITKLDKVLY